MSSNQGSAAERCRRVLMIVGIAALLCAVAACGSPDATVAPSAGQGGDPRSSGQGPGLVGDPLFAIGAVVAIGLGALLVTLAYVRMTSRRSE
jgi:hypothetical protein